MPQLASFYLPPAHPCRAIYDAYLWLSVERTLTEGEAALIEAVNAELRALADLQTAAQEAQ